MDGNAQTKMQAVDPQVAGLYAGIVGKQMSAAEYERQRDAHRNAERAAGCYNLPVDEVLLRRWAIELVVRMRCVSDPAGILPLAKAFVDFAMTGAVPSDDGKA